MKYDNTKPMRLKRLYRIFVLIEKTKMTDRGLMVYGQWQEVEGDLNLGSMRTPQNENVKKIKMFSIKATEREIERELGRI